MLNSSGVRSSVITAKQQLHEVREKLAEEHANGASGREVCRHFAELADRQVGMLFQAALDDLEHEDRERVLERVSLVVHGGVGRFEMAPYSDIDLMLLHEGADSDHVTFLAQRLSQDIFDSGYRLGLSVRTPRQTFQMIPRDATVYTSLCESRLLSGSKSLYDRYRDRFLVTAKRRMYYLIDAIEHARKEERVRFGETVYLLRPHIKKSRGALRDVQMVRWVALTRYGESDFRILHEMGALTESEYESLGGAQEFLLRLRNELHFNAGKSQDLLNRRDQVRIAEAFGYEGTEAALPVEEFMSEYFRYTSEVRYSSANFLASARSRSTIGSIVGPIFSVSLEGDFRVGPIHVGVTRQGMEKVTKNLVDVLRLMELASAFNRRIDHPTWQAIRNTMLALKSLDLTTEASERFMALLNKPTRLAALLRRLHEMRVLEKILPAFRHTRGLLQFNEYHKYTVDEHSIRSVEYATQCVNDDTLLGSTYRSIKQKGLLHLAILLHDAGKGYKEDHSEIGMRLAEKMAVRLGLSEHETETLKFLVHKHLLMSHLAFRRNVDDAAVVAEFAAEVGSVEVLKMLYVLTCADLAAVGPEVLNEWKLSLLAELFERARDQLAGDYSSSDVSQRLLEVVDFIHSTTEDPEQKSWLEETVRRLPASFLSNWTKEELIEKLLVAMELKPREAEVWCRYLTDSKSIEFTIVLHDRPLSGYFHRMTGVLTSSGMEILFADVTTLARTLVVNRFVVHDLDHSTEAPPESRLDRVSQLLYQVVTDATVKPPTFRTLWSGEDQEISGAEGQFPTRVRVDNDSSEDQTLIDVFTNDRNGLLYLITQTLYELGLQIKVAKIGTYANQVVDAFYVVDSRGRKVIKKDHLERIRDTLLEKLASPESVA